MSSRREQLRLHDIVDEITRIESYTAGLGPLEYARTRLVADATERCLERVIEAVVKIGPDRMASIAPELPFDIMRGLGNRLRHLYDTVDDERVFEIVRDELPRLKERCAAALENE